MKEPELRQWLRARASDGYSFPMNPVWPVRDPGWYDVLQSLQRSSEQQDNMQSWFPPEAGILAKIDALHSAHPKGFCPATQG